MKKLKLVTALAVIFLLMIEVNAQESNSKQMEEGQVRVMIMKDHDGKVSEINETFSIEEREKINALLEKEGVELNLDELEKKAMKSGDRILVEMELEEEDNGEEQEDVRIVKVRKVDSFSDKPIKTVEVEKIIEEGQPGKRVIKIKNEDGTERVMVIGSDNEVKMEDEMIFENTDGERFEVKTLKEGDHVFKTMVFISDNGNNRKKGDNTKLPRKIEESKVENMSLKNLKLFPNPTNGNFNMSFETQEPADVLLSITDSKGARVFQKELKQFKGKYTEDFNLSEHESGLYFFNLESNGEKVSHKVIVQ